MVITKTSLYSKESIFTSSLPGFPIVLLTVFGIVSQDDVKAMLSPDSLFLPLSVYTIFKKGLIRLEME